MDEADQRCERDISSSATFYAKKKEDVSSQRKDVSAYAGNLKRGRDLSSGNLERGDVAGAEVLVDDGRSNPVPDVTE